MCETFDLDFQKSLRWYKEIAGDHSQSIKRWSWSFRDSAGNFCWLLCWFLCATWGFDLQKIELTELRIRCVIIFRSCSKEITVWKKTLTEYFSLSERNLLGRKISINLATASPESPEKMKLSYPSVWDRFNCYNPGGRALINLVIYVVVIFEIFLRPRMWQITKAVSSYRSPTPNTTPLTTAHKTQKIFNSDIQIYSANKLFLKELLLNS